MKSHGMARIAVLAASIALLVSACSSDSSSDNAGGGDSSRPAGPKGTPILIGNIGSYTGAQGSTIGTGEDGVKAWADAVNAAGGINGRPVKLIIKDDAQNPTTALSAIKELIAAKVVAIVSNQSSVDTQWAPTIAAAGIPVLGGADTSISLATNPDFFPIGANLFALTYGTQVNAKTVGDKFGSLYCAESPQCAIALKLEQAFSKATGVKIAFNSSVSATAPDYTALCQKLKDSGVQSYAIGTGIGTVERVATACRQQGVQATQQVIGALNKSWLKNPAFDKAMAVGSAFPFFLDTTAGTKAFQDAIKKYGDGKATANSSEAWVSGKLFEAAVAKVPAGKPIDAANIKAALYTFKGETLGGLTPPLTYSPGKPTLINCWYTTGIADGKFVAPNGMKLTCAPDAIVGGVVKGLAGR